MSKGFPVVLLASHKTGVTVHRNATIPSHEVTPASSEAGAHAENILFAFMAISITEVLILCSKECKISASLTAKRAA